MSDFHLLTLSLFAIFVVAVGAVRLLRSICF